MTERSKANPGILFSEYVRAAFVHVLAALRFVRVRTADEVPIGILLQKNRKHFRYIFICKNVLLQLGLKFDFGNEGSVQLTFKF